VFANLFRSFKSFILLSFLVNSTSYSWLWTIFKLLSIYFSVFSDSCLFLSFSIFLIWTSWILDSSITFGWIPNSYNELLVTMYSMVPPHWSWRLILPRICRSSASDFWKNVEISFIPVLMTLGSYEIVSIPLSTPQAKVTIPLLVDFLIILSASSKFSRSPSICYSIWDLDSLDFNLFLFPYISF